MKMIMTKMKTILIPKTLAKRKESNKKTMEQLIQQSMIALNSTIVLKLNNSAGLPKNSTTISKINKKKNIWNRLEPL